MSERRLPYGRQHINSDDIDAVCRVLKSDFITQGPLIPQFEEALSDYCGAKHAVAVNSATSALHIACMALGVGKGDSVWTTPNTFVASANCARYCLADVDFVDIDPRTYNMCPKALATKLKHARANALPLPKVIIVVHFAGQPCDMSMFAKLADKYDFKLIEDASHAIGATYEEKPVGNCRYSDITVFSFHPVKIITTCEGGMALTNSDSLAQSMRLTRSHGVFKPEVERGRSSDEPWAYEQVLLGYNYRMTDVHAALGLSQMRRLGEFVDRRHELALQYSKALSHLPFELPSTVNQSRSALHLYPILVSPGDDHCATRLALFQFLQANGIGVNVHYIPVHTQPYYQNLGYSWGDFPVAEDYYQRTISLPLFGTMTDAEQDRVIGLLEEFSSSQPRSRLAA
ncbi:MAG: UDP-4-amino-4,6-dideoxy-N-acetyl-beta-L-altrosamine transaminase [Granulosicoccus sp.]